MLRPYFYTAAKHGTSWPEGLKCCKFSQSDAFAIFAVFFDPDIKNNCNYCEKKF